MISLSSPAFTRPVNRARHCSDERYGDVIHWNTIEWLKHPDTGKRKRVMRPRSERVSIVDESFRIVSSASFAPIERRI